MTIRNSPNADQCVLSGPSYAKWHPKNYGQNGERWGGENRATHSMQMLAKQIFNHLFFCRLLLSRKDFLASWLTE